jgi:hypothetical protein
MAINQSHRIIGVVYPPRIFITLSCNIFKGLIMLLLSLMFTNVKAQNCGDCASSWMQGTTLGLFPPSTWGLSNCEIRVDYSYRLCINAGPPVTTLYEFKINTIELENSTTCNYNMDSIVKFSHKSLLERAFAIFQINTNSPGFAINVINPSCLHCLR